jgi:hypothetical protein
VAAVENNASVTTWGQEEGVYLLWPASWQLI